MLSSEEIETRNKLQTYAISLIMSCLYYFQKEKKIGMLGLVQFLVYGLVKPSQILVTLGVY